MTLHSLFPISFRDRSLTGLVIAIVIYVVVGAVAGAVIGFLSSIPILGIIFSIIGALVDIYCLVGLVLAILYYAKVVE
ncbi:MAG: hypothetical protein LUE25_05300 [Clostridiales bacterium]|nr:hypothetical protein [Clostridiales bacterium]